MKNIKETAESIYNYCVYAMDYDLMGLTFSESSLENALREKKEVLTNYSEDEFAALIDMLGTKVLNLYEKNRVIAQQEVKEDDVIGKMSTGDAVEEMKESEAFLTYVNELSYVEFKKIVA